MPKIHFGAEWSIPMTAEVTERLARRERPEGVILLRVDRAYLDQVRESFSRLHGAQVSRAEGPLPLEVTVEYGAAKRSLDANRLMWALYGFMAEVQNAGHQGTGMVTKEDLYRADMQQFADVYQLVCHERDLESLRGLGWAWRSAVPLLEQPGKMLVDMIVTSSKWDSLRFHKHLQLMFNRLAEMEPPPGGRHELLREWAAWRQELNDQRVQLVTAADQGEYRAANPVCEGCGRFVGHGGGEIHHISSRGSRAQDPTARETPANWLHLCHECHASVTAVGGGVARFLERFPHNRNKVEAALRRTVPAAVGDDGVPSGVPDNEGGR